jgi:hypothetical protein
MYWSLSSAVGVKFANPPAKWEGRSGPEEMSQTWLTNKKQRKTGEKYSATILLCMSFHYHTVAAFPKYLYSAQYYYWHGIIYAEICSRVRIKAGKLSVL